jgi:hypothetical protein
LTEKISLIVPLRLTANTHEGELRLRRLCATVPRDLFDIVISDYGTEAAFAGPLEAAEADGITVVLHPSPGRLFSIGHARDFGVQMARQKVVIFNDIDFLGTPAMYRAIHAEAMRRDIARNIFDFFCVPVLFLTEEGTKAWLAAAETERSLFEDFSVERAEASDDIQFTAFGSSAMVVNRHHYLSLGGHDPKFSGHGAEDYDLLHRLAALAPKGPRPHDYFADFKDNSVRNYWGFRAFYALYGLDVSRRGVHLVHLWHPRRMEKGYFRSRPNFRHLKRLMRRFDRNGAMPLPLAGLSGEERWLVIYRTQRDMALARQLLPFCRHYRLVRARSLPAAYKLTRLIDMENASTIVIAPDVGGDISDLTSEPALSALSRLVIRPAETSESYEIVDGEGQVQAHPSVSETIRSGKGRVLYRYWPQIALRDRFTLESGALPVPEPLSSPLFSSFGGETLFDKKLHPRPNRKKKSSFWVKLKRRLTGY